MSSETQRTVRKLAAVLVADIVGYTRLMEADETGTHAAVQERITSILEPTLHKHGGRIVKIMGDGVLVEFTSAVNAVTGALEVQRQMDQANQELPESRRVVLRIGINLGDVISEGADIYGDGVNVAARLEGFASPGGICVSAKVFEEARNRIDVDFEDAGEQHLKNILLPVRIYRALPRDGVERRRPVLAATDKPSIAVLPFENLSSDPEQQYFSDGFTEDIITELSRFRELLVIARNSSFQFRGKAGDVRRVARELGVRFVVEGSLRRSGQRIRVTAQLIDALAGNHVWADRFDRDLNDVFVVQDEVIQAIVAKVAGHLEIAEAERVRRMRPENMAAYDCFLRGLEHSRSYSPEETGRARGWFEKALEGDPNYAAASALLAVKIVSESLFQQSAERFDQALSLAKRAVSLDPNDSLTHAMLGVVHLAGLSHRRGSTTLAAQELDTALRLNPNEPDHMVNRATHYSSNGQPELALQLLEKAERLNPILPDWYLSNRGFALFGLRRYAEAAQAFEQVTSTAHWDHYYLAACYAHMGRSSDARLQIAKAIDKAPYLTVSYIARASWYTQSADLDHLLDGLRQAGLPQ